MGRAQPSVQSPSTRPAPRVGKAARRVRCHRAIVRDPGPLLGKGQSAQQGVHSWEVARPGHQSGQRAAGQGGRCLLTSGWPWAAITLLQASTHHAQEGGVGGLSYRHVWPPRAVLCGDSHLPFPPASPPRENPAESPELGLLPSHCLKLKAKNKKNKTEEGRGQPQSGNPPEELLSGCVPLTGLRPLLSTGCSQPAGLIHGHRGLGGRVRQRPDSQFPATPAPATSSLQVAFRLDFEFSKSVFLHHLEVQLAAGRSGPGCSLPAAHLLRPSPH